MSIDSALSMLCAIGKVDNGVDVVYCSRHDTPSHYHHDVRLLADVDHRKCLSHSSLSSLKDIYLSRRGGCTIILFHLLCIYPGNTGALFPLFLYSVGYVQIIRTLWHVGRVRLFARYTIPLSSLCRLIRIHWTSKRQVYAIERVFKLSQLSPSSCCVACQILISENNI